MMTNLDWNGFCELYFETAKGYAEYHLRRMKAKGGELNRRVDEDYVVDAAVLSALEKTYAHYNPARGTRITTYLSNLVHNELVDVVRKESRAANAQATLDDVKSVIRSLADEGASDTPSEMTEQLLPLLQAAVAQLSPSDQVILNYYLEDKSNYVTKSSEVLHVGKGYVSVRRNRIMKLLPKLMGMNRNDYLRLREAYESTVFASNVVRSIRVDASVSTIFPDVAANFILPSLDCASLAGKLAAALR